MKTTKATPARTTTTATTLTAEAGKNLVHQLLNDVNAWGRFLMEARVQGIIFNAILGHGLQGRVSVNDVGNSFFLYSLENNDWLTKEKNPAKVYSYFAVTVHHLLGNRKFMKEYLGIDLKVDADPLPPVLPMEDDGNPGTAIVAAERMDEFRRIICEVSDHKPDLGELLERYYLDMEDIRTIAADFLHRGLVKSSCKDENNNLAAATNNLQTRKLNAARNAFNDVAQTQGFPYTLNGKVKKSIIRDVYHQADAGSK